MYVEEGMEWHDLRRVDSGQFLAIAALYEFIVDEETNGLCILPAIGSCEFDLEI